jgi:hypothetical protein
MDTGMLKCPREERDERKRKYQARYFKWIRAAAVEGGGGEASNQWRGEKAKEEKKGRL